uniref:S-type anion channel SLAH2-like n=1 Tax=Kalanchoe fedtschenkoi TaxID=63787 RepID=A0A7N0U5Y0_KALFE
MENIASVKFGQESPDAIPSLIKYISSVELDGFDSVDGNHSHFQAPQDGAVLISIDEEALPVPVTSHQRTHSISLSMPASPLDGHASNAKSVAFSEHGDVILSKKSEAAAVKKAKFHSQPMPRGAAYPDVINGLPNHLPPRLKNPVLDRLKDKRFDSFKTWSGKLERQISNLRGRPREEPPEGEAQETSEIQNLPVHRFFDALEGPELDTLKASEELVLPEDKRWPFLLRFPVSSFGICLGVSSQAIMWKALATSASMKFLHVSPDVNLILWCISLALVAVVSAIYALKLILYFEAVRREYYHPIRVNFFFAPWIALLFLGLGAPPFVADKLHDSLWYILMTPIFCLELKIYGQWMSGGQRRLSKVANPSNHLAIVGNFVGALLGARMGLKEGPIFFFAVGLAHYTVLFVTLYQRLPTNETLPKELHPVFFLFVAAPSVASMAWADIQGSFDHGSRIAYFIAMFLYFSLAVRVNFFRGFKFSLAWWAYTFPMTGAAIATMRYANVVDTAFTRALSVILCAISTLIVTALLVTTVLHAFVFRDLFPNDISIAISNRRSKPPAKKWFHHLRHGSSDTKDIENFLKFADSADPSDLEASLNPHKPDSS